MNVPREIKKEEAIRRMKALDLYKPYIESFIKRDEIFMSEMTGGVYEFSSNTELCNKVREFEDEHKALVYHIIRTVTVDGEIYSFLFVSDYQEEWEMDNADIQNSFCNRQHGDSWLSTRKKCRIWSLASHYTQTLPQNDQRSECERYSYKTPRRKHGRKSF